jgi:HSP20 family protein
MINGGEARKRLPWHVPCWIVRILTAKEGNTMTSQSQLHTVPVRMYTTDSRIMIAAPMPGLEPDDISVAVADAHVTIRGQERGPRQHERDLLLAEWTVGPYERQIQLPQPVNGALANATYGNGVLVLALPILASGQPSVRSEFVLEVIAATRGERVGHSGRDLHPTTTQERRQKMAHPARTAQRAED